MCEFEEKYGLWIQKINYIIAVKTLRILVEIGKNFSAASKQTYLYDGMHVNPHNCMHICRYSKRFQFHF